MLKYNISDPQVN